MKATADEIGRVVGLLKERGFTVQAHASGTNIEGELEDILAAVGLGPVNTIRRNPRGRAPFFA